MKKPIVAMDEDSGNYAVFVGVQRVSPPFKTPTEANIWADGYHRGSEYVLNKVREKVDAIDGRVPVVTGPGTLA